AMTRYGMPQTFFERYFVANFCPLIFFDSSGKNITPDKIPVAERKPLLDACNKALLHTVEYLKPRYVAGIGRFAERQCRESLAGAEVVIGNIPHPSPANPRARKNWGNLAEKALEKMGVKVRVLK
ncbi:MAG: single-stranded DNA-binding protein, partial [Chitinivibrionales bacterium]|nr:single-stranded DNA-binding protein [Chitinivibrionales bacterium]